MTMPNSTYPEAQFKTAAETLPQDQLVLCWRLKVLLDAGYGDEPAAMLAVEPEADLHDAIALRRRGCPIETALAILL